MMLNCPFSSAFFVFCFFLATLEGTTDQALIGLCLGFDRKLTGNQVELKTFILKSKTFYENQCPSPDSSENPYVPGFGT